jgi:putative effector of murein hydrolase LrgA (UPF0299 family)
MPQEHSMIPALVTLLVFQLFGEVVTRGLGLPLPGPVLGMVALVLTMLAFPKLAAAVRPTAQGLLAHLSLLFVPAGVGVVAHLGVLRQEGAALMLALIVSTVAAIAVGALTFTAVARLAEGRKNG